MGDEYVIHNRKSDFERKKRLAIIVAVVSLVAFILFVLIVSLVAIPMLDEENKGSPVKVVEPLKGVGAILTDNQQCTKIASDVLKSGGPAVDAVVAALFCTSVLSPDLAGLGGGFQLLAVDGTSSFAVDAMPTSPDITSGVGVPRMLAGVIAARGKSPKVPLSELVKPSIHLARNGLVSPRLALAIRTHKICEKPTALSDWLCPDGVPKPEGASLKNERLAQFLESLADKEDYLAQFTDAVKDDTEGGFGATPEPSQEKLLEWRLGSENLVSAPTAAAKQLRLGSQILQELSGNDTSEALRYHLLSEAQKFSLAATPRPNSSDLDSLKASELASRVKTDGVLDQAQYGLPNSTLKLRSEASVLLMAATSSGSLAILTASIGTQFGSGSMSKKGFLYNQVSEKGSKVVSYSCPVVVKGDSGELTAIVPDDSTSHALTAAIQIMSSDPLSNPSKSLVAKRINSQVEPEPILYYEPGFKEELLRSLKELGHNVEKDDQSVGVHIVAINKQQIEFWFDDTTGSKNLFLHQNYTIVTDN